MKFYCIKCTQFQTATLMQKIIEDKNQIIASKDEIITLLRQKIAEWEVSGSQNTSNLSYSGAAQQSPLLVNARRNQNTPSLLIMPKNKQKAEITKKDIHMNIKPSNIKVGIKNTRDMPNGGIIVRCHNKNDVEKLKCEAEAKLTEYNVQVSKLKKPRFKIVGYEGDLDSREIEQCLIEQNQFISETEHLKITYIRPKGSRKTSTIYGECCATLFEKFMNIKKIFLEWECCMIYEDIGIQRCFKCQEFFHRSENCQNNIACCCCGENHDLRQCPKETTKCANCEKANNKYGTRYKTNHQASDISKCSSYQYHLNIIRSKIDYSGSYE